MYRVEARDNLPGFRFVSVYCRFEIKDFYGISDLYIIIILQFSDSYYANSYNISLWLRPGFHLADWWCHGIIMLR